MNNHKQSPVREATNAMPWRSSGVLSRPFPSRSMLSEIKLSFFRSFSFSKSMTQSHSMQDSKAHLMVLCAIVKKS